MEDSLCTGLLVMLVLLLLAGLRLGTLHAGLHACRAAHPWAPLGGWLPAAWWGAALGPVLHSVTVAVCCVRTLGAGAAGVVVLVGFGLLLLRWRLLRGLRQRPVVSVGVLLGVGGGMVGAWGVSQLGGLPMAWVPLWVVFIAVHLSALLCIESAIRVLRGWWVAVATAGGALVVPCAAALLPFWPWWAVLFSPT